MDDQELPAPPPPSDADPTAEQKLYWLNALQVVGDWSVHDDGDGRLFYYDRRADSSQWEVPESLAPLETEFMMKLMLQNAVARSGAWTAHDAGNGTLYYFNSKTRVSAWERPSEWGEQEAAAAAEAREREAVALLARQAEEAQRQEVEKAAKKEKKEKREKKKHKKHKKQKEKRDDEAGAEHKTEDKEANEEEPTRQENVEEEEPLTAEEVQEEEERKAREQKRIELFRAMLRDKNIMPFCKWSVALPQIAGDPRFMGVPTMDERRAIFEHFVEHRREDLKAEKKSKLKQAKQSFAQLLREQFRLDSWDPKTTLSVFLSTLEEHLQPERYKQLHDDALALLTLSAQEKLYAKAVAEYKTEALKRDGEQLRLTKFLEDAFASLDISTMRWESDEVQKLVLAFYGSAASSGESEALLSAQRQQQVFDELVVRTARSRQPVRGEGETPGHEFASRIKQFASRPVSVAISFSTET
ncbi:Spliceosomal protein FBP11/Splicing factor PRP40 [Phytophthora cinnamomi]|uniref:Spliceosomal protein FBP11/Splicing factor PRP40 n=1 Tax=Phytophthora cinnamomi TaxID=4785 RepID=UPI0035598475|nr:Spliceosomal protein FBP11/Splicing factor PRP40 [Phytophthora cinnamomi]